MPSAPYCTSSDVYFMRAYAMDPAASDFPVAGTPRKSVVEYWIDQMASRIDMLYASVGYEIPLAAITGETWPTHQTTFLQYLNAIGVASIIGGNASTPPVVSFVGGRRESRSFYEHEWMQLMEDIRTIKDRNPGSTLIRAATLSGTGADYLLTEAMPPLTDWLEGYTDPTHFDTLRTFTKRWQGYMTAINQDNLPSAINTGSIDYLYVLHNRLGYTYAS